MKQNFIAAGEPALKKSTVNTANNYIPFITPEEFGAIGDGINDDSDAINEALSTIGENGTLMLSNNKVYLIKSGLKAFSGQSIIGNGSSIKRADEQVSTLAVEYSGGVELNLSSSASSYKVGDDIVIFIGHAYNQITASRKVISINGSIITVDAPFGGLRENPSYTVFPIGSLVMNVFTMLYSRQYPTPWPVKIFGVTFDGNAANNMASKDWYTNSTLYVFGPGTTISGCKFINIPNENIITSGGSVVENYAENLSGSFVHLSSPPNSLGEDIQGTFISGNVVMGVNITDNAITGHSESPITQSWNAGKTVAIGNQFYGTGKNWAILFTEKVEPSFADFNKIIYANNIFDNFSAIVPTFTSEDLDAEATDRVISNNSFINCGHNDFSALSESQNLKFKGNYYFGNTEVVGNIESVGLTGEGATGTWPININGNAENSATSNISNLALKVDNGVTQMKFSWALAPGQPPLVWGADAASEAKVYDPLAFSVDKAKKWGDNNYTFPGTTPSGEPVAILADYGSGQIGVAEISKLGELITKQTYSSSISSITIKKQGGIYRFTGTIATYTLPPIIGSEGKEVILINRGSGNITLNSASGENDIDQLASYSNTITIPNGGSITIINDGTKWCIINMQ